MNMTYFVEVLHNNGDVNARQAFLSLPIHIGRNYQNDIILDDPHTAAVHACIDIDAENNLVITDQGSLNGIRLGDKKAQSFLIHGDDIFYLGQTQIRIRTSDYAVAPEVSDRINHRWEGWPRALLATLIIVWLAFSNSWLGDVAENKSSIYLTDISAWLGVAAVWAALWALANRVFEGNAYFSRHLFILSIGLFVLDIWGYTTQFLAYGLSLEFFTRYGSHIEIIIFAVMIFYHLCQVTPRQSKRLLLICASLSLFGSSLILLNNYQNTHQLTDEFYMHEMLPPVARISEYHSLQAFEASIDDLKADIEEDRLSTLNNKELK